MAKGIIKIEGLDETYKWMQDLPKEAIKITRKASQSAAKKIAKGIRAQTPTRFKRLVRYKVDKNIQGVVTTQVGLFNIVKTEGEVDDWFKAYWKNHGTLTHRDPNHKFKRSVKSNSKGRRNNVGQRAERFFNEDPQAYKDAFMDEFENYMTKHQDDFYKKNSDK